MSMQLDGKFIRTYKNILKCKFQSENLQNVYSLGRNVLQSLMALISISRWNATAAELYWSVWNGFAQTSGLSTQWLPQSR